MKPFRSALIPLVFISLFFALILSSCSSEIVLVQDNTTIAKPSQDISAIVVDIKESSKSINVKESSTSKPVLDSWAVDGDIFIFTNLEGTVYKLPTSAHIVTDEGKDRTDFRISVGDWFVLNNGNISYLFRYSGVENLRPNAHFFDGEKDISIPYNPINIDVVSLLGGPRGRTYNSGVKVDSSNYGNLSWDDIQRLNPAATFDQYADSRSSGKGTLLVNGTHFNFFIGSTSGSPISIDLDGDDKIRWGESVIRTISGEVIDFDKLKEQQ